MKKLLIHSASILKNNLLFIQPVLFYFLTVMMILPYILSKNTQVYPKSLLALSVILLSAAATAGFLYINKQGIKDYNPDDTKEEIALKAINNFKAFFSGVGEYFARMLLGYIFYGIIYLILFYLSIRFCTHFAGEPVIASKINDFAALKTINEFNNLLNTFSAKDIQIFRFWVLVLTLSGLLFNFLGFLYFTVLIFEKDNIIKSMWKTLVFFIKNIPACLFIIAFMFVLYIAINILTMLFGANALSFAILIILAAMYLNYYIILLFCFYNERTQNNSNNGTDSIGEDITCN